jgi:hypothetical protein
MKGVTVGMGRWCEPTSPMCVGQRSQQRFQCARSTNQGDNWPAHKEKGAGQKDAGVIAAALKVTGAPIRAMASRGTIPTRESNGETHAETQKRLEENGSR